MLQRCWIVAARRVLRMSLVRTVTAGEAIADASDAHRGRLQVDKRGPAVGTSLSGPAAR